MARAGWDVHVASLRQPEMPFRFRGGATIHLRESRPLDLLKGRLPEPVLDRTAAAASRIAASASQVLRRSVGIDLDPGVIGRRPMAPADASPASYSGGDAKVGNGLSLALPSGAGAASWVATLIDLLEPSAVHSFGFREPAVLMLLATQACKKPPSTWLVSDWRSDLAFYERVPALQAVFEEVLAHADCFLSGCRRDAELARLAGFSGTVLGPVLLAGGFDVERLWRLRQPGPSSERRIVVLEGDSSRTGPTLAGLEAIRRCADLLTTYKVVVIAEHGDIRLGTELLQADTGIEVLMLNPRARSEALRYLGRARASLHLAGDGGEPGLGLDAIVMGAFPIRSRRSCARKWTEEGVTGALVHAEDPGEIAEALREAISDGSLVDRAAVENRRVAVERLDKVFVEPRLCDIYKQLWDVPNAAQPRVPAFIVAEDRGVEYVP
jgi:hypothetical protein